MIKPVLKGEALVKNIHASSKTRGRLSIWWLGQSGFLIQWEGVHLLCDPYLSDALSEQTAESDHPLIRMTELAVEPAELAFIQLVTASDLQRDHLDPHTLKTLLDVNPNMDVVIPEAVRAEAAGLLGCDADRLTGLDDSVSENVDEVTITGVSAVGPEDRDGAEGRRRLGFIFEFGPWMIYHSGDIVHSEELIEQLQAYAIDVALLPIAGSRPGTGLAETLTAAQAADLAKAIDARLVIPCHYEMFDDDASVTEDFARACERIEQPFRILRCGEPWTDRELEGLSPEEEDESFDRTGGRARSRSGEREPEDY